MEVCPLSYQWRRDGIDITGATNEVFLLPGAQLTDSASYDVVVSGACAPSVTSISANLSVDILFSIK